MSTKIYNGVSFTPTNFFLLNSYLTEWKTELVQLCQQRVAKFLAIRATESLDAYTVNGQQPHARSPLSYAWNDLQDRQENIRVSGRRDPAVDFGFEIVLIPYNNRFLGLVLTEQRDFRGLFMCKPYVHEFAYWDNTDRPEHCAAEEWAGRGRIWNEALGGAGIPARVGAVIQCSDTRTWIMPPHDLIAQYIPDYKTRKRRLALERVQAKRMRAGGTSETMVSIISSMAAYIETDAGREAVAQAELEIESLIRLDLSIGDLAAT